MAMESTLKLVGKTSSEIFMMRYPSTLIGFCEFDFSFFAQGAIDACNEALKTGAPDFERISDLRRDIQSAHCFIEHNVRTTYEKIVYDCWIDYVCRRDNIGPMGLWNRFIRCKTPFEKAIFARLCEYRYNRAVNEWLNIVRIQDYANSKLDFIFIDGIKSPDEAAARRNYFDLMFSVTARELGCRIEDLGVTKVFSVGRVPTAPFMFPNISKEIVRHVLSGFDYSDDYSDIGDYTDISDQIAMDAFSRMKAGLPQELSSYNIVRGKMEKYSDKIYMPCSLKAAVDLEIDAIIDEGSWLSRCKRCGRYFLRNSKHPEEYCSRFIPNGKTCLQIYEEEHPQPKMTPELDEKCRAVTDEVYSRVDKTMSAKEYESWYVYLQAMRQKVENGEISPMELDDFLDYSLEVDITKSHPIVEVPKREHEYPRERVVKPFVPKRISRSELPAQPVQAPEPVDEEEHERAPKDGFFTSPTVQRNKSERPQISHIIRNGESRGENRESYTVNPDPAGFRPFDADYPEVRRTADTRPRNPAEDLMRLEERIEEENRLRRELEERDREERRTFKPFTEPVFADFSEESQPPMPEETLVPREAVADKEASKAPESAPVNNFQPAEFTKEPPEESASQPQSREEAPRPKVIRKNAAAISAYGKMAGAPLTAAPPEMQVVSAPPENAVYEPPAQAQPPVEYVPEAPDPEPFKDIGSIFDVLEQSESEMGAPARKRTPRELPRTVTRENAPSGFWTEDRGLFPDQPEAVEEEPSELELLKEKKHAKSSKTQRLFDVIMREPDDNPNFRK